MKLCGCFSTGADGGMNRLTANDDDRKVRDWFIEETAKYGCEHKVCTSFSSFSVVSWVEKD